MHRKFVSSKIVLAAKAAQRSRNSQTDKQTSDTRIALFSFFKGEIRTGWDRLGLVRSGQDWSGLIRNG